MRQSDRTWHRTLSALMPEALTEARERPGREGLCWVLPNGWQLSVATRPSNGRAGVRLRALKTPDLTRYDFLTQALALAGELGLSGWPTRSNPLETLLYHELVLVEPGVAHGQIDGPAVTQEAQRVS